MKNKGLHQKRFKDNPREKRFAEVWESVNKLSRNLDYILTVGDQHFPYCPTERERVVAASVIQWLGSPVGQSFLDECGFIPKREPSQDSASPKSSSQS